MEKIKKCEFAGTFYPDSSQELEAYLSKYLTNSPATDSDIRAIIAPHAGYIYSGEIAATAYQQIASADPQSIILISPSHNYGFEGIATADYTHFETPLGKIESDLKAIERFLQLPQVNLLPQAFSPEHSFEVHLPFIKAFFPKAKIIPFIAGSAGPNEIAEIFSNTTNELIVVSSDLSHFHPYEQAQKIDNHTEELINKFQYMNLTGDHACGYRPIQGLLVWAKDIGLKAETIMLKNSGDTAGDKESVVGYGSFALK